MDQALLLSMMVFLVTVLLLAGSFVVLQSRKTAKDWGKRIRGKTATAEVAQSPKGLSVFSGFILSLVERLGQVSKPKDQAEQSQLRKTLITAGYRGVRAPFLYLGSKLFLGIVCAFLFFIFGAHVVDSSSQHYPVGIVASGLGGFYLPVRWLDFMVKRRKKKLVNGFPDALDLMVVCVEAGLGLDQAIARVGEEIKHGHRELGEEFELVSLELRAGFTREQALRNLGDRTDLEEIRGLIALLIQTDRFGTSIGQALRVHSESMRMNRRLRAEELAAKLPVKLMLPLIAFIFPALLVVIIGPGVIRLMRNFLPAMGG